MWLPAEVGTNGSHGDTDQQFFTSDGAEAATRLVAGTNILYSISHFYYAVEIG